jgi:hypothetical protein
LGDSMTESSTPFGFVSLASCLTPETEERHRFLHDALNWHNNVILDHKKRPSTGEWSGGLAKYFDGKWRFSLPYDQFVLETYCETDGSCNVYACFLSGESLIFHHSVSLEGEWAVIPNIYKLTLNDKGLIDLQVSGDFHAGGGLFAIPIYTMLLDRISYFNSCPGDPDLRVHCASDKNARVNVRRLKDEKKPTYEFKIAFINNEPAYPCRPYQGGSHASPTMHKRRGHFRKYLDKLVWVKPCVVGLAKNGVTEKAYVVT